MQPTDRTSRQIYEDWKAAPRVPERGIGPRVALINVDIQRRYTDTATFSSSYDGHPRQFETVNALAREIRRLGMPVIWTYVAYLPSGVDAGIWSELSQGPMAIHRVGHDSPQAEIDARAEVHAADLILHKRMASAFFETHLPSFLTWRRIDSVIVTGGATSGCVRGTVVDAMSHGYRVTVPEETVTDREEGAHFASLYDIAFKYGDVKPVDDVLAELARRSPA